MAHSPTSAARRQRVTWALAMAVLSAVAFASVNVHGHSSREFLEFKAGMAAGKVAAVSDVVSALHLWQATGVRGRNLLVLSGRWSRPTPRTKAAAAAKHDGAAQGASRIDANSAVFEAAALGIARRIDVVMPPGSYAQRLGTMMGQKGLVREASAFRLPSNGYERRFSTPEGFKPGTEMVLLLIEPSWFEYDVPADPLRWLKSCGVSWDLAVIATDDPAASPDQKQAAVAFATAAGAEFVDLGGE